MGKLIWIASYPKSGNTWIRIFLNTILINPEKPLSINEISRLTIHDSMPHPYEKLTGKKVSQLDPQTIAQLRPQAHEEMTKIHPNPVLVKTHNVLGDHFGTPLITPEATAAAIYLVRNPLDIVASYANHRSSEFETVIENMAKEHWRLGSLEKGTVPSYVSSWSSHVKSWTIRPHPSLLVLRYEDLIGDTQASFTRLTQFLRLDRSEEEISRAIRFTTIDEFRKQEAEEGFHERSDAGGRFFRSGKADGWQKELSDDQVERIVARHRDQMERFGYLPEGM